MEDVKVSVICLVYNHEKFLRRCLDGFVNQKVNFTFEVLIHDDASTDSSKDIIIEYYEKYPNILNPIFEKENQYSKHISISNNILLPKAQGKYIAFCEGDDYWCDDTKLQKQFDYMEEHPECSMCTHNTIIHDLSGKSEDKKINNWSDIHILNDKEVFYDYWVHTTSYFIRKEIVKKPEFALKYWAGDYALLTLAHYKGQIACLPYVMSVYNNNNPNGKIRREMDVNVSSRIRRFEKSKDYLDNYNEYTNKKYDKIICEVNKKNEFMILIYKFTNRNITKEEYNKLKKQILMHDYFKKYYNELELKQKIIFIIKKSNYLVFKYLKKIKK